MSKVEGTKAAGGMMPPDPPFEMRAPVSSPRGEEFRNWGTNEVIEWLRLIGAKKAIHAVQKQVQFCNVINVSAFVVFAAPLFPQFLRYHFLFPVVLLHAFDRT